MHTGSTRASDEPFEIVKRPEASEEAMNTAKALMIACGKKPAALNTYVPGFIANCMGVAINREHLYMIDQRWEVCHQDRRRRHGKIPAETEDLIA